MYLKIRGKTVSRREQKSGHHFIGLAWVAGPARGATKQPGMFDTLHGMDMVIVETDSWQVAYYHRLSVISTC